MLSITQIIKEEREMFETQLKAKIDNIERGRKALFLLQGAGFPIELPEWRNGDFIPISLGLKGKTKKERAEWLQKLQTIRRVLGRLTLQGKDVYDADKRLITVWLSPAAFENVRIEYQDVLPRSSRCQIERKTVKRKESCLTCPTGGSA